MLLRRVLDVGLLGHAEVRHHGVQPLPLLLQLQLQLADDLHLYPRLRRALVVQHVGRGHVLQELPYLRAVGLAARPLADAVAEEGVLARVVRGGQRRRRRLRLLLLLNVVVVHVDCGLGSLLSRRLGARGRVAVLSLPSPLLALNTLGTLVEIRQLNGEEAECNISVIF